MKRNIIGLFLLGTLSISLMTVGIVMSNPSFSLENRTEAKDKEKKDNGAATTKEGKIAQAATAAKTGKAIEKTAERVARGKEVSSEQMAAAVGAGKVIATAVPESATPLPANLPTTSTEAIKRVCIIENGTWVGGECRYPYATVRLTPAVNATAQQTCIDHGGTFKNGICGPGGGNTTKTPTVIPTSTPKTPSSVAPPKTHENLGDCRLACSGSCVGDTKTGYDCVRNTSVPTAKPTEIANTNCDSCENNGGNWEQFCTDINGSNGRWVDCPTPTPVPINISCMTTICGGNLISDCCGGYDCVNNFCVGKCKGQIGRPCSENGVVGIIKTDCSCLLPTPIVCSETEVSACKFKGGILDGKCDCSGQTNNCIQDDASQCDNHFGTFNLKTCKCSGEWSCTKSQHTRCDNQKGYFSMSDCSCTVDSETPHTLKGTVKLSVKCGGVSKIGNGAEVYCSEGVRKIRYCCGDGSACGTTNCYPADINIGIARGEVLWVSKE